jgi:hypothetical protein
MQRIGWWAAAALSVAMGMAGCGGTSSQDPARSADRVNRETAALQRFEVTAITTGVDLPADGYGVLNDEWDYDVGDGVTVPIPTNGTVNLYLRSGNHTLSLVGIPANCAGEDVDDRYVIGAPDNAVTTVVFRVVCAPVSCTPTSCAALGRTCGTASDDCGGTLTCGPACSAGSVTASYDGALKAPLCASLSSLCSATTTGRARMGPEANSPNTLGAACPDGTGPYNDRDDLVFALAAASGGSALTNGGLEWASTERLTASGKLGTSIRGMVRQRATWLPSGITI